MGGAGLQEQPEPPWCLQLLGKVQNGLPCWHGADWPRGGAVPRASGQPRTYKEGWGAQSHSGLCTGRAEDKQVLTVGVFGVNWQTRVSSLVRSLTLWS